MTIELPVMKDASSEHSQITACATSSGFAVRPNGYLPDPSQFFPDLAMSLSLRASAH